MRSEKIANDENPFVDWIKEAFRVLKNNGCLLCFTRWDVEFVFRDEMTKYGFTTKQQLIWDKQVHGMGDLKGDFAPQHENIIFATKGNYLFPQKRPTSVFSVQRVSPSNQLHPNEKPVQLIRQLVEYTTNEKAIVLDCFGGSCVTSVACKEAKRECITIELSPKYCKIGEERLKQEILI